MGNRHTILAVFRILTFFLAVFLVANLLFLQFFVLEDTLVRLPPMGGDPSWQKLITDDLALDGSLLEQYANFMVKMLSGEFFLSTGVRKFVPTSEFIYSSALTTAGEVISVLLIAFAVAGLYGYLASRWSAKLRGKVMLSLALVGAVSFVIPVLLFVQVVMSDLGADAYLGRPFIESVAMASIPVSAAFVFIVEGWLRRAGPVDLRKPYELFLTVASGRGFSAVLPIFLVYAMTCVLFADMFAFRGAALGSLTLDAVWNWDISVLIACIFVTAVMLLTLFLFADLIAIYASRGASRRVESYDVVSDEVDSGETGLLGGVTRPAALDLWRAFRKSGVGMLALLVLVILIVLGACAPFLSTVQDPRSVENQEPNVILDGWINPLPPSLTPSPYTGLTHPLGTDPFGRDVYSLLLYGSLESMGSALLIAVFAVVTGMGAAFARAFVQYVGGSAKEAAGWFGWLLSDVFLAVPISLVFIAILMSRMSEMMVLIALVVFLFASFGKGHATSLLLRNEHQPSATDYGPPLKALSVSEVMHVGKYCFLFCFFSIAFIEFLFHSVEFLGIGWMDLIELAYSWGAIHRGTWWLIVPPMIMIGLVAASIFVMVDRLERILHSWAVASEADSAQAGNEWKTDYAD
jgi:peptide/nickel transport system permease protein